MVSLSRSFNRLLSLKEKEGKGNATKEELQSITSLNKMLSRGKGINDGSDICFKEENVKISDVWNDDIERKRFQNCSRDTRKSCIIYGTRS